MFISRVVCDVGMALKKLYSHFRHPPQGSKSEWPVISATQPLFYLIRVFGLAPFGISEDHFIPRNYDVVYCLFCTFFHTCIMYEILSDPRVTRYSDLRRITKFGEVIFNYCVVMSNLLMAVWTRKKFIEVLTIVKNFDSRIRDLGHPRKENTTKVWVWSTCIGIAVLWIIVSCTGMAAFTETWTHNMLYMLNYLSHSLSTLKFASVVLLLGQRFRDLNKVAQLSKESATTKRKYIMIDFQVIQQLHNSLMNAGESLSSQYELPLFLWLANLCFQSIIHLYSLIDWLTVTPKWAVTRWSLAHCTTWWLVTCTAQLLLIHIACHFTTTEANSMGSIVIIRRSFVANGSSSVESTLPFINRQLNFSAAGCFNIDLPLLHSITALFAKYLILLFQIHGLVCFDCPLFENNF